MSSDALGGGRASIFGAPADIVEKLRAQADERDDPLLRIWCDGQDAERRMHDHWTRHRSEIGSSHQMRREAVRKYAFSVTHRNALSQISAFVGTEGLVSIGAGTGWWEHRLVLEEGLDVVAYDIHPPGNPDNHWYSDRNAFFNVQVGDVDVLKQHAERVMFLSWPPYQEAFARRAVQTFYRAGGRRLIYVGEGDGGCCADDKFFDHLRRRWSLVTEIGLTQWQVVHDSIECCERRG